MLCRKLIQQMIKENPQSHMHSHCLDGHWSLMKSHFMLSEEHIHYFRTLQLTAKYLIEVLIMGRHMGALTSSERQWVDMTLRGTLSHRGQ